LDDFFASRIAAMTATAKKEHYVVLVVAYGKPPRFHSGVYWRNRNTGTPLPLY
jgi:hypothetical protein